MGYGNFIASIDAIIMGRITFETVCSFDVDWPYDIPVFVLSNTLTEIPASYKGKAYLAKGPLTEVLAGINEQGFHVLYIDGVRLSKVFCKKT